MSDKCKHHVFIWERCEACVDLDGEGAGCNR
jgi:hypothetical protein